MIAVLVMCRRKMLSTTLVNSMVEIRIAGSDDRTEGLSSGWTELFDAGMPYFIWRGSNETSWGVIASYEEDTKGRSKR
jgi:hypothetical protein